MPRRRDVYEDGDYEDDRPRRRTRRKREPKGSSSALLLWLVLGFLLLLVASGATVGIIYFRDRLFGPPSPSSDATLIAYWSFDDAPAGRIADKSSRGNDAFLYGARIADGKRGQGLGLDGRPEQYVELPAGPEFDFAPRQEFTIAGWFRTFDGAGSIVSLRHTTLPTQVEVLVRNARLQVIVGADTDVARQAFVWGKLAGDGNWHHFALVRIAGGFIELYQDGDIVGQAGGDAGSGAITTDVRSIGCERLWVQLNDMRWGRPGFNGAIDEIYIYRRALSATEITKLMRR